jgi:hypothetical protein
MKAPPGASIDERLKVIEDSVARAEDCIAAVEAAANRSVEALRASLTELIDASRAEVGHLRSTLEALPVGALDFELVGTPDQSAESPEQQMGGTAPATGGEAAPIRGPEARMAGLA